MNLTALEMKQLAEDARTMGSCRGYLSDALQCLRDTGDPIAPLALLRALWSAGYAKRDHQKLALNDAGQWLDKRLGREPGISFDRLALELGWLHRLVMIESAPDGSGGTGDARRTRPPSHRVDGRGRGRDEPAFGAHIDLLRHKRELALARVDARLHAPRDEAAGGAASLDTRPERLPDSFEVRFASWEEAVKAFRKARERRREQKPARDRLLLVEPVAAALRVLAGDIACSLLDTEGMDQLQARAKGDAVN
jgi:hypothetical protein